MKKVFDIISIRMFHILGGVAAGLSVIIDCLIKSHKWNGLLVVSNEFIFYVFSLIFTVATLGLTLLSIIVSVSNNKILGLRLREIVSLKDSPLKIERVIIETLIVVAISIVALAFELCNTMTVLAGFLICYLINNTRIICRIVFSNQYAKDIVYSSISSTSSIKVDYVHSWITQLLGAIDDSDISSEEEYLELIKKSIAPEEPKKTTENTSDIVVEEEKPEMATEDNSKKADKEEIESEKAAEITSEGSAKETTKGNANEVKREFFDLVAKQIPSVFSKSCMYQSFVDSYKRILRLNDSSCSFFDERSITYNYISSFKYADPKELASINISGTIEDIIMCDFLSEEEKTSNCYWLFDVLLSNGTINDIDRMDAVYAGFSALLWLDDVYGYCNVRVKTAIRLFRNKVLLAKDYEQGTKVYTCMLKAMYTRNQYRSSKPLASLLAQIIRMIYFWAYLEVETLSEQRRELIANIPNSIVETNDNAVLSIGHLIHQHHNQMVEFLIGDAFIDSTFDPLDYWPDILNGKSVICTKENKIKFALWFYSIWGYGFCSFPIEKYISLDAKDNLILQKSICIAAREEFAPTGKELTIQAKENVSRLQRLYKETTQLPIKYLEVSFTSINSQIMQINDLQLNGVHDASKDLICTQLLEQMRNNTDMELDESLALKNAVIFQLSPLLCLKNDTHSSIIVHYLGCFLVDAINELIKKSLSMVQLSFNLEGIVKLKDALAAGGYLYRNYTFYDDWGIEQAARESTEFSDLKELVDLISYHQTHDIREYLFLKVESIKYNYSIEELSFDNLRDEQLESYLKPYKVADEQYNIDGGVYYKTAALDYFAKTRSLMQAKLRIATNIRKTSGFKVGFKEYS